MIREYLLRRNGWHQSTRDGLWRNERFGGSYLTKNAFKRLKSQHGEKRLII